MLIRCLSMLVLLAAGVLAGCGGPRPVDTIRAEADLHFRQGRYREAATHYQEIAQRYPGDWQAQHKLGLTLMELDELTDAHRALDLAHSLRPANDEVAAALAEVLYRQGNESQLYAFLRERAESTQRVGDYMTLAKYAMEMGDPDSAQTALATAIELDHAASVEPYLQSAAVAQSLGDLELAVRRLRQAYGIAPRDERVNARLRELGEIPGPTLALPPGR